MFHKAFETNINYISFIVTGIYLNELVPRTFLNLHKVKLNWDIVWISHRLDYSSDQQTMHDSYQSFISWPI